MITSLRLLVVHCWHCHWQWYEDFEQIKWQDDDKTIIVACRFCDGVLYLSRSNGVGVLTYNDAVVEMEREQSPARISGILSRRSAVGSQPARLLDREPRRSLPEQVIVYRLRCSTTRHEMIRVRFSPANKLRCYSCNKLHRVKEWMRLGLPESTADVRSILRGEPGGLSIES